MVLFFLSATENPHNHMISLIHALLLLAKSLPQSNTENVKRHENSAKLTDQRGSYAFTCSPLSIAVRHILPTSNIDILVYATADEADAYMFDRCFFLFFSVRHKIPDNRSRERLNGFS